MADGWLAAVFIVLFIVAAGICLVSRTLDCTLLAWHLARPALLPAHCAQDPAYAAQGSVGSDKAIRIGTHAPVRRAQDLL